MTYNRCHPFCFFILTAIAVLILPRHAYCADTLRVMQVFDQIQNKTGFWNVSLIIKPEGRSLFLDKTNTIVVSNDIINLCFQGYSAEEGNNRLAFLLSHEIAHIMNNDLDYDRFLNPYQNSLSNELLEVRKQKELNADLRAVSIMCVSGYSTGQFSNEKKNIITDIYKLYRLKKSSVKRLYADAAERVRMINFRKQVLNEYNRLYECGNLMLMLSEENDNDYFLDICIEAYNSYQNYTSITTPELLNNMGLCYIHKARLYYSKDFMIDPDTLDFRNFEWGYVINSEVNTLRSASGILNNRPSLKTGISSTEMFDYRTSYKKAVNCFNQALLMSNNEYLPARLNPVVLYGLNQQYEDARALLADIKGNNSRDLSRYHLLPFYYNLNALIEYCLGQKESAKDYLKEAVKDDPEFIAAKRNMELMGAGSSVTADCRDDVIPHGTLLNHTMKMYDKIKPGTLKNYPFGLRDKYNLSYSENDSMKIMIVRSNNSLKSIELIGIKHGEIPGTFIRTGSNRQDILAHLSRDYTASFSQHKKFYHFKKAGLILCFGENELLDEIIILNKTGYFGE